MTEPNKYDRLRAAIADVIRNAQAAEQWAEKVSDETPFGALEKIGGALVKADVAIRTAEDVLGECEEEDA